MKKYSRNDQRLLATWAADCALRVLKLFENARPQDYRPRKAIAACRKWVRTGIFRMSKIRAASLGAHAAARDAKSNEAACFAARAAGHAVATAHVPQHAYGSAFYALKAMLAAGGAKGAVKAFKEKNWQEQRITDRLRGEFLKRVVIEEHRRRPVVMIRKGADY